MNQISSHRISSRDAEKGDTLQHHESFVTFENSAAGGCPTCVQFLELIPLDQRHRLREENWAGKIAAGLAFDQTYQNGYELRCAYCIPDERVHHSVLSLRPLFARLIFPSNNHSLRLITGSRGQ